MPVKLEKTSAAIQAISTALATLNLDTPFLARGSAYKGYKSETLTFWSLTLLDKAKFLKMAVPLAPDHYASGAESWKEASNNLERQWTDVFHEAIRDTFGREPQFTDYQVSGIGRSEFAEDVKSALRAINSLRNQTQDLAFSLKLATGVHAATAREWLLTQASGISADDNADEHEVAAIEAPRG